MSNKKEVIFLREEYGEGSGKYTYPHGEKYVGDGRKIKNMVKENLLLEKGNLKETSMKGTGKIVNNMVKEHSLYLMERSMWVNSRMGESMVKESSPSLME